MRTGPHQANKGTTMKVKVQKCKGIQIVPVFKVNETTSTKPKNGGNEIKGTRPTMMAQ